MRRVVFRILCSENKGTDQLCGHRAADMRFCFCRFTYAYVKSVSKIAIQHILEFSWGSKLLTLEVHIYTRDPKQRQFGKSNKMEAVLL